MALNGKLKGISKINDIESKLSDPFDASVVIPHSCYLDLAKTDAGRQGAYRRLFVRELSENDLEDLRQSIRGGWVIGSDKFKAKIARALDARVTPAQRGGDRKSEKFRRSK